jgi:hypothetical protein
MGAGPVHLDEEVQHSQVPVTTDRRVGANYTLAVDVCDNIAEHSKAKHITAPITA